MPSLSRRTFITACGLGCLSTAALARTADVEPGLRIAALPASGERVVALTFDACMGDTDHRILDTLVDQAIPATIFATHRWLRKNTEAIATLLAHPDLFEIENHGDMHLPAI